MKANIALALCSVFLISCGLAKTANDTKDQVVESNKKQGKLLERVDDQAIGLTCLKLVSPEAEMVEGTTDKAKFMIFVGLGEHCAEYANTHELIKYTYTLSQDLKQDPGTESDENDEKTNERISKLRETFVNKYFALGALASAIPDDKFEAIVQEQIARRGEYFVQANELAAMRFYFIANYRIKKVVDDPGADVAVPELQTFTLENLKLAVEYYNQLKYIATSPYRTTFSFLHAGGAAGVSVGNNLLSERRKNLEEAPGTDYFLESYSLVRDEIRTEFERRALEVDKNSEEAKRLLAELN